MNRTSTLAIVALTAAVSSPPGTAERAIDPFAAHNGEIPPRAAYDGPLHRPNFDYPRALPEAHQPWRAALDGGPLTVETAEAYVRALKRYVDAVGRSLLATRGGWDPARFGWYSMLWAGDEVPATGWEGREAISGSYTGQVLPAETYAASGLKVDLRNYAVVYYNDVGAYTLHRVWRRCDRASGRCPPTLEDDAAQFADGTVIIKSAGVNACGDQWPVMEGAARWLIYRRPFDLRGTLRDADPQVTEICVGIFDIVVKDSVAAPKTGWVFSTLVYDKDAPGETAWERMVPLGAMWGNDPELDSARQPTAPLRETWVNPAAPEYAKVTLGWGGRLAGPFDIAVKTGVIVDGKPVARLRASSCLSCHGTASYDTRTGQAPTFLYPAQTPLTDPWHMYTPGSPQWNRWFQDRPGTQAQDPAPHVVALDYSTFLSGVLANYAATQGPRAREEALWEGWRRREAARRNHRPEGS